MKTVFIALLFFAMMPSLVTVPVLAVEPNEIMEDPALEARARTIGKGLRCLVCQNQSIDDSDAQLARDLRLLIREQLLGGASDDEALAFVVERYGDYVLLRPPLKPTTYLLWLGPFLLFAIAITVTTFYLRRRRRNLAPPRTLSPDEERRIQEILDRHP